MNYYTNFPEGEPCAKLSSFLFWCHHHSQSHGYGQREGQQVGVEHEGDDHERSTS